MPTEGRKQQGVNSLALALGANGQANTGAMLQEAQNQLAAAFDAPQYANVPRTNEQFVADLYLAYLQRPPEPGAIAWFANFLNTNQLTRLQLRNEFANGPEFAGIVNALYGNQSGDYDRVDRLINQIYTAATGNLPTTAQRDGERGRFDTAEAKGLNEVKEAAKALGRDLLGANTGYRTDLSTTEYVTRLYQTFLRRAPDNGLSGYVTQADAPNGRHTVLEAFLAMSAYTERSGALYREIYWLISDHLGTPRMIAERTGKLEGIKRNDSLPFGESANTLGGRATTQGYAGESVRQGFTGHEEDSETGLIYAQARYLSASQGRFVTVDPVIMTKDRIIDPQRINLYVYVRNNPHKFVDITGEDLILANRAAKAQARANIDKNLSPNERKNVAIRGNKVVIVNPKAVNLSAASEGYKLLNEYAAPTAKLDAKYYGIKPGQNVTTASGASFTYQQVADAADVTVHVSKTSIEVIVAIGASVQAADAQNPPQPTPFPEHLIFTHGLAHGSCGSQGNAAVAQGMCAVNRENLLRQEQGLPLRSTTIGHRMFDANGNDTTQPFFSNANTTISAGGETLIDPGNLVIPATQINLRPLIPLPKKPN